MARGLLVPVLALTLAPVVRADDWPQWMGPQRDGVWREDGILEAFPPGGPKKLWTAPVKGGYSGPAVAGGRVYVLDYDKEQGDDTPSPAKKSELIGKERVLCFDAKTGTPVWKHAYDCAYKVSFPAGPRCTPTVAGGKVYAIGTMGNLHCLDAATGKVAWAKDFKTDYNAEVPIWGFAGHPLVYRNLLICVAGGPDALVVALDKDTGTEKWRALSTPPGADAGPGYSPPTVIDAGGTKQLVVWHSKDIVGLNPDTGAKYWSVPLKPNYGMAIMAPQQSGGHLFAGGIGGASEALKLDAGKPAAEVAWKGGKTTGVYPVNMTPLIHGGVIYGVDQPGMLRAVDLATGKRLWFTFRPVDGQEHPETYNQLGSGTAFLVRHGDRYFVSNEKGDLVIAKLTPKGYEELGKAHLLEPTGAAFGRKVVWSHPAFADRCVFARNDKELACYSLAK